MNRLEISSITRRKTHAIVAVIVAGLLLVLPSCAIPKLQHAGAGAELPNSFNGGMPTQESSAQLAVEEFFNDPLLTNLITEGLSGNQQLNILAQDIQIANNEIRRRRGAFLPLLSLGAGASLNKYSYNTIPGADNLQNVAANGQHFPKPYPDFLVAGNLTWQIDIWRQLRNARDSAGLRYLGTIDGRTYVVTRIVAEIAENYYTLMALDKRLENLDRTIMLQQQSLQLSIARKDAARGTELAVQRFQAEVQRNQSEKLIINQEIVEVGNRINFLLGRFPQPVDRNSGNFLDLNLPALSTGVPAELLLNRPDIRQAERELQAAGLDVRVARANFYPKLIINAGVGYEAFNTKYLFQTPESLIYNTAGNLVAPLINKSAIRADYMTANARQIQAAYDYQRTVLNAFTEVVNRVTKVQNYSASIQIKKQQLESLESAVNVASNLFQNARVEYIDVLFAQRDLRDARTVLIDTKKEQLSAVVNAYQALGGGATSLSSFVIPDGAVILPDPNNGPAPPVNVAPEPLPKPAAR